MANTDNAGIRRKTTQGVVLHATHGNAATVEQEFQATLNWFRSPASQVSAHAVIAWDGTIAYCVSDELEAWHSRELNGSHLGVELAKPRLESPLSDAQYRGLAWLLNRWAAKYGFPLDDTHLPEHRETAPGKRDGKLDIGGPFDRKTLMALITQGAPTAHDG